MVVGLILTGAGCLSAPGEAPKQDHVGTLSRDSLERQARAVTLRVRNISCEGVAVGSGVALGDRLLITNAHVVSGADEIEVATWSGEDVRVRVAGMAPFDDVALVAVSDRLPAVARLAETDPAPGEKVTTAGFPEAGRLTLTHGRVLDYVDGGRFDQTGIVMRSDAPTTHGNSGGPVLQNDGRVAAIVFGGETATGDTLAIPASVLQRELRTRSFTPVVGPCST